MKWECNYFFWEKVSFPLDVDPGVGSLDHMIVLFLISHENLTTVFHSDLHSRRQCMGVPFSPHPVIEMFSN